MHANTYFNRLNRIDRKLAHIRIKRINIPKENFNTNHKQSER